MFFEIINLKIPFIFILDEKNFYFSKIGIDLMNFLKNNNLLFESGDIAAEYLNKIKRPKYIKTLIKSDIKKLTLIFSNLFR